MKQCPVRMSRVDFAISNSAPVVGQVLSDRPTFVPPVVNRIDAKCLKLFAANLEFNANGVRSDVAPTPSLHEQEHFEIAHAL